MLAAVRADSEVNAILAHDFSPFSQDSVRGTGLGLWEESTGHDPRAVGRVDDVDRKIADLWQAIEDGLADTATANARLAALQAEWEKLQEVSAVSGEAPGSTRRRRWRTAPDGEGTRPGEPGRAEAGAAGVGGRDETGSGSPGGHLDLSASGARCEYSGSGGRIRSGKEDAHPALDRRNRLQDASEAPGDDLEGPADGRREGEMSPGMPQGRRLVAGSLLA
jgi:hypothetical protein